MTHFFKIYYITLIIILLGTDLIYSQGSYANNCQFVRKEHSNIQVHFRFDRYILEPQYMSNSTSLQKLTHIIDSIGVLQIDSVVIISQSSPEGVYEHNLMLSKRRANTLSKYILKRHPQLSERLYVHSNGESWSQLREYVKKDTLLKNSTIEKVISVIDAKINVGTKKWRMQRLPVYRYLLKTYYPLIRNTVFCIIHYSKTIPVQAKIQPIATSATVKSNAASNIIKYIPYTSPTESPVPDNGLFYHRLHLKTNALGLGLGIANIAAEIDMAEHWSFSLPVYYSGWDYFKTTIKFRTFAIQPEFRYWFSRLNDGLFAGVHVGLGYYNLATNGKYRYQDLNRETPAIGTGINIGYRIPIGKGNHWRVEFSVGAGAYKVHYDIFHNTPNSNEGLLIRSIKRAYWGIDQASISFSYTFHFNKKGGKL